MKLVIVESPTKSKTIGHYLGDEFIVEASVGHIRDLAKKGKGGFGVDIENNFKPTYVIDEDKVDVINKLKKLAKKADDIYLATDPDREGEAIAWHLSDVLGLPIESTKRLEFHEITEESITHAIANPRTIDMNLVHSQETRRIIDRILGFKLSTLLNQKIKSKSAGRVQSATLKLICEHEKEIQEFVPEEYWTVEPYLVKDNNEYKLNIINVNGKKPELKNKDDAENLISSLGKTATVNNIDKTKRVTSSKEPFRTSTLQQEAFNKLNIKIKELTVIAQQLYEGVETDKGLIGLITYIRTDSTRISDVFVNKAKDFIVEKYGANYFKGVSRGKTVKMAQDAHECIRPTSVHRTPESMKQFLTTSQYRVYKLIYDRTLAYLMSDKIDEVTTVNFMSNTVALNLKGAINVFPGYNILNLDDKDDRIPQFNVGEVYDLKKIDKEQHFTKPPARFSEARIVKMMEEKGIGRPSTYSSTIQTIVQRKYVTSSKGVLTPTEQGILTSNVLGKYFPDLINTEYTAEMENLLDEIQEGKAKEADVISNFYYPFIKHFDEVKQVMYKEPLKKTGEQCPLCGSDLVIRHGKYGEFVSCSDYPNCHYIKKEPKEVVEVGRNCPECGAPLIYRVSRKGSKFIGCSNFPKCHYLEGDDTDPNRPVEEDRTCPECGNKLVLRKSKKGYFYGCSNFPKCRHIEPIEHEK